MSCILRISNISILKTAIIFILLPWFIIPAIVSGCSQNKRLPSDDVRLDIVEPVIFWNSAASGTDSIDQLSFCNVLGSIGFLPEHLDLKELNKIVLHNNMLIVLPHASASLLTDLNVDRIMQAVAEGARVITDGDNRLAQRLQLKLSQPVKVGFVRDRVFPSILLSWADNPSVPLILNTPDKSLRVLYTDSLSRHAAGILKISGKGMALFFSPVFDPFSAQGYSRFPDLPNLIISEMHCLPLFQRHGIDAYFDPGYKWNIPIDTLVSSWKKWGIRAIHAAAWYFNDNPSYDYKQLISKAHKQGITVYAWIEWPYVGIGFWNKYPEWREKNALLKDAQLDFLQLMDLQNTDCMKMALGNFIDLLKDDWDGIDIAEFSITGGVSEALEGPRQPKYFTGFNSAARNEFKTINGFDQVELFNKSSKHYWKKDSAGLDKFYRYRVLVNNRLLRQIVSSLDSVRTTGKRDWEFIFTVLDNSLHSEFDQLLGFDLSATIRLAKDYHATLQVEDPASEWTRPPSRYEQLAKAYTGIIGNTPLAIDINIVPVHPFTQNGFASSQPTGTELIQLYRVADIACSRVCFYAESYVYKHDWEMLPYAMASEVSVTRSEEQWQVKTPHTVIMQNPDEGKEILLDGRPWPCYSMKGIFIPEGEHNLSFGKPFENSEKLKNALHLSDISGELISCSYSGKEVNIIYHSPTRCLLTANRSPRNLKVDGKSGSLKVVNADNRYIIFAPSGKHFLQFGFEL
jgi:hypothetical protein